VIENYGLSPASVADPTPTHEEYGYADIPAITALRSDPTTQHVHQAIEWPGSAVGGEDFGRCLAVIKHGDKGQAH
jgi:hypothetical protein